MARREKCTRCCIAYIEAISETEGRCPNCGAEYVKPASRPPKIKETKVELCMTGERKFPTSNNSTIVEPGSRYLDRDDRYMVQNQPCSACSGKLQLVTTAVKLSFPDMPDIDESTEGDILICEDCGEAFPTIGMANAIANRIDEIRKERSQ